MSFPPDDPRRGIQGRIIQINSKSGKVGGKHNSGYSAAKFGGVGTVSGAGSGGIRHYRTLVDARQPGEIADVQSLLPQYAPLNWALSPTRWVLLH